MTNVKLIPVSDCHKLSDSEIEDQIRAREDLIRQMVGSLYPTMLSDEIQTLRYMIRFRKNTNDRYDRAMGAV